MPPASSASGILYVHSTILLVRRSPAGTGADVREKSPARETVRGGGWTVSRDEPSRGYSASMRLPNLLFTACVAGGGINEGGYCSEGLYSPNVTETVCSFPSR